MKTAKVVIPVFVALLAISAVSSSASVVAAPEGAAVLEMPAHSAYESAARTDMPVADPECICCWHDFDPWPMYVHNASDTQGDPWQCEFSGGDWWVKWGHGPHGDILPGACYNGTYHGGCVVLAAALDLGRDGRIESLIPMLAQEDGLVRLSADGEGLELLSCDLTSIAAWVPLNGPAAALLADGPAVAQRSAPSAE